jgi:hypothetical protein
VTKVGLDAIGTSTTLESNKSQCAMSERDSTITEPVSACHRGSYAERDSRFIRSGRVHDLSWSTASGPSSSVSLRHAVFLSRRHAKEVQGVPDVREVAEAVQSVGLLPGSLRLCQFRRGALPTLPRPRRVCPAHEAKRLALPAGTGQLRAHISYNGGIG